MAEREILFRGKGNRKYNSGGWYHGYLSKDCDGDYVITEIGFSRTVIPSTVGRYTGLTDKNGKRIFEGDIVRTKYGRLCTVIWFSSNSFAGWDLKPILTRGNLNDNPPDKHDLFLPENLEIIGNVHDNPELLKGEKNA